MTDTELRNRERILQSMREELEEVYRFRKDTEVRVNAPSNVLIGRSGWVISVAPVIRPSIRPPFRNIDIHISRFTRFLDMNSLINNMLLLFAAAAGFVALRYYMGDPKVYLYRWICTAGFFVLMAIILPFALQERKGSEKVFPPSEAEHLRNRLKLQLEEYLKRSED